MPSLKDLTPEERVARLKQQRLEAGRRFYDLHKRKRPVEGSDPANYTKIEYPPGTPISCTVEYIKEYRKKYYQANRDKILARANQRHKDLKAKAAEAEAKEAAEE